MWMDMRAGIGGEWGCQKGACANQLFHVNFLKICLKLV